MSKESFYPNACNVTSNLPLVMSTQCLLQSTQTRAPCGHFAMCHQLHRRFRKLISERPTTDTQAWRAYFAFVTKNIETLETGRAVAVRTPGIQTGSKPNERTDASHNAPPCPTMYRRVAARCLSSVLTIPVGTLKPTTTVKTRRLPGCANRARVHCCISIDTRVLTWSWRGR